MQERRYPRSPALAFALIVSASAFAQEDHSHAPPAEQPVARMAYIANAGMSVATAHDGVLIDVLFREGQDPYARVQEGTLEHIETTGQPFDEVRAVLITSKKPDHFDAQSVSRFLHHNSTAVVLAPPQVIALLREQGTEVDKFSDRIRELDPKPGEKATVDLTVMSIDVLTLSHDPVNDQPFENFGYIVHMADRRLLHVGDAKFDEATKAALRAHAVGVDVACVPYWWLEEEAVRSFLSNDLKPKFLAAYHVPPDQAEAIEADIKSKMERVIVLTRPFASRRL